VIFVSSSCFSAEFTHHSVQALAQAGFRNIELTGGGKHDPNLLSNILELKVRYDLNLRCHNYFPVPTFPFVLNLGSKDNEIRRLSFQLISDALMFSRAIGGREYGLHAGYLADIPVEEIGNRISSVNLVDYDECLEVFATNLLEICSRVEDIDIFVENNVVSKRNFETFGCQNCFLLTDSKSYDDLQSHIHFDLLLDVGHLFVSCNTLGLDYELELKCLNEKSRYLHLSDNNGLSDQNLPLDPNSTIGRSLRKMDLQQKTITLEITSSFDELWASYEFVERCKDG